MERDPVTKELVPDRKRFPNGIKPLADYVNKTPIYSHFTTRNLIC